MYSLYNVNYCCYVNYKFTGRVQNYKSYFLSIFFSILGFKQVVNGSQELSQIYTPQIPVDNILIWNIPLTIPKHDCVNYSVSTKIGKISVLSLAVVGNECTLFAFLWQNTHTAWATNFLRGLICLI